MLARSRWTPPLDRNVRAEADEVLNSSEALLQQFKERRATYQQWEANAAALLSRLNCDLAVSRSTGELDA